jgi:dethiobiotin synthetase
MGKSVFIIGTDTDCGKTTVTAALATYGRSIDIDVGVMKPFESASDDSLLLREASESSDPVQLINPYHFDEALAPGVAAKRAKQDVSFEHIQDIHEKLQDQHEWLLIEGAGGLMVPLQNKKTHIELLKQLNVPVLLIARLGLGTINHSLLTLAVLEQHEITCLGIILNEQKPKGSVAEETNPEVLENLSDMPVLGVFPFIEEETKRGQSRQSFKNSLLISIY